MTSSDSSVKTTKEMEVVEEQEIVAESEKWEESWKGTEEGLAAGLKCGGLQEREVNERAKNNRWRDNGLALCASVGAGCQR